MLTCTSCGGDVTGKKFCPACGTPVQSTAAPVANAQRTSSNICPRCQGEIKPGAAFCMHCGSALNTSSQAAYAAPPPPTTRPCPACYAVAPAEVAFCTNCGHNLQAVAAPQGAAPAPAFCTNCGRQNAPGVKFCAGCGHQLAPAPVAQPGYMQSGQYPQQPQYPQTQYQQPQYPQPYGQPQYPQQYGQGQPQYPQQYGQGGYQPQPMMGQPPMVLRCPTCRAMAPLGTANCVSCRTNLAGVMPTPANMPVQGQQGVGGFLQGDGGKYAMGALGGAAAVIGGEMLLHGLENTIEDRVEGDMGYGHHRHHHREEGLGGLGELANDIGLF